MLGILKEEWGSFFGSKGEANKCMVENVEKEEFLQLGVGGRSGSS